MTTKKKPAATKPTVRFEPTPVASAPVPRPETDPEHAALTNVLGALLPLHAGQRRRIVRMLADRFDETPTVTAAMLTANSLPAGWTLGTTLKERGQGKP